MAGSDYNFFTEISTPVHGENGDTAAQPLKEVKIDAKNLVNNRHRLTVLSTHRINQLEAINPATFPFLTEDEKKEQLEQLKKIQSVIKSQWELNLIEGNVETLRDLAAHLDTCEKQIALLEGKPAPTESKVPKRTLRNINISKFIIDCLNKFNDVRLYWVWAGSFLAFIFDRCNQFNCIERADHGLDVFSVIPGVISYVLYGIRLLINLFMIVFDTLRSTYYQAYCQAKSENNDNEPTNAQIWGAVSFWDFMGHLGRHTYQRVLSIANDLLWGVANFFCFTAFKDERAFIGDWLTFGLLAIVDLPLLLGDFSMELARHRKAIRELNLALANNELTEAKKTELSQLIEQENASWREKQFNYLNTFVYSVALAASFGVFCAFHLIAPGFVQTFLGLTGAFLCYAFSVARTVINHGLQIQTTLDTKNSIDRDYQRLLKEYQEATTEDSKKLIFTQISGLSADFDHQQTIFRHRMTVLAREAIVDIVTPIVVTAALAFMPFGIGMGVLALGLTIAFVSWLTLRAEPTAPPRPEFDEKQYTAFDLSLAKTHPRTFSLFGQRLQNRPLLSLPPADLHDPLAAIPGF